MRFKWVKCVVGELYLNKAVKNIHKTPRGDTQELSVNQPDLLSHQGADPIPASVPGAGYSRAQGRFLPGFKV